MTWLFGCQSGEGDWARHVAFTGERRGAYRVWWGDLKERGNLEDIVLIGDILLCCVSIN